MRPLPSAAARPLVTGGVLAGPSMRRGLAALRPVPLVVAGRSSRRSLVPVGPAPAEGGPVDVAADWPSGPDGRLVG